MLRVGIVGAGRNTKRVHIPNLQAIGGVEISAVCNRSVESGSAVADAFGIPQVHTDWLHLVASDEVDAVVVGTWPDLHAAVTIAALQAGKHVLTEARMARTATEARRMLEASRLRSDLVAQVVPSPVTLRVDEAVRSMIEDGAVGSVLVVNADWRTDDFIDPAAPLHWRMDQRRSGNNIMSLGIVYESLMRWVGTARSLTAVGSVFIEERLNPETGRSVRIELPDHLDVVASLESGAQCHYQFSSVTGLAPEPSFWIHGSDGTIVYRPLSDLLLHGDRGDGLQPVTVPAELEGGWRVEEDFVAAIRGEADVTRTTFEDGVRYMEFVDAVDISLREGRFVDLAEV